LKKLAIITTHPIQYNVPFFRRLSERCKVLPRIYYTWGNKVLKQKYDPGFGAEVEWDIPLLEGYDFCFTKNTSKDPGTHHFLGIRNPQLRQEIKEWKPDAILVYGWSFHSHLACMRYFHHRLPVIFRGDSTLLDDSGTLSSLVRNWFLKWVYCHVDRALYTGKNNAAYFRKSGLRNAQLVFAPHAVDNFYFADNALKQYAKKADLKRREFGFSDNDIVFLFAGKWESKKDPVLLIRSFQSINRSNIRLVLAGSGNLKKELEELAARDKRILLTHFHNQSEMPVLYRVANWFVLPSKGPGETWGLAVNEAMACGIPVIASDRCGCTADLIQQGVNGYRFAAGSLDELTQVLEKACDSDATVMGRSAEIFIQAWSIDNVCEVIEGLPELQ